MHTRVQACTHPHPLRPPTLNQNHHQTPPPPPAAVVLADTLTKKGYSIATGGTDNHLILWDLRPLGLTGSKVEKLCDTSHITLNKNAVHGDKSALAPGGVRIGTCALTTRGLNESDFAKVGDLLHQAVQLCSEIQLTAGKMLKDFLPAMEASPKVAALREEVHAFAGAFPMPGL